MVLLGQSGRDPGQIVVRRGLEYQCSCPIGRGLAMGKVGVFVDEHMRPKSPYTQEPRIMDHR